MVKGKGYRRFSTLAAHSQVTWKDENGIHDEDIVREPKALRRYTAGTQWNALSDDPIAGINPVPGSRPSARYYGIHTISDSHPVNKLTLKYLRLNMQPRDLLCPCFCLQHHTGNTASDLAKELNLFTRVWTLAKTFCDGDFFQDLVERAEECFADEDEGLEVVDPEHFQFAPGDLGKEFTIAIMDCCYKQGLGLGEDDAEDSASFQEVKHQFIEFFPYGWNRKRPVHPCPAGCCGPTACADRKVSVKKGWSQAQHTQ